MAEQHGLFKHHKPTDPQQAAAAEKTGESARRLRTLEERYGNLERRLHVTEDNMVNSDRHINMEIKAANSEIRELQEELAEVREKLHEAVNELRETARRDEVALMQKELSYWQPLNFVTRQQVEKMIRETLDDQEKV